MSEEASGDAVLVTMRKERDAARRELRDAQAEVERLRPFEQQATALTARVSELTTELEGVQGSMTAEVAMARMGLDDVGAIVAKAIHAAQGGETPLVEWLSGLEGDAVPKPLQPYLAAPSAPAPAPSATSPEPAASATPAEEPPASAPAPRPGQYAEPATRPSADTVAARLRDARAAHAADPNSDVTRKALQEAISLSRQERMSR